MIFGVTGYYCTGKDEFANFLEKEGFTTAILNGQTKIILHKKYKI